MKRHAVAFLLHPYKNTVVERSVLKTALDTFAQKFIDLSNRFVNLRLNVVFPGYMLECIDPILLLKMREIQKRGALEWLACGYTEPFIGFEPARLVIENVKCGLDTTQELTGVRPSGFVPPFSCWEPSFIELITSAGIAYSVLSRQCIPGDASNMLGFWMSEHSGSSIGVFPAHLLHKYTAPSDVSVWLDDQYALDPSSSRSKLLCVEYVIPLLGEGCADAFAWLTGAAEAFDKLLLKYQSVLLSEFIATQPPIGLMYLPPSLVMGREENETQPWFLNKLHTYDQVGLMQRRLMETGELFLALTNPKTIASLKKKLFFAQDINRYLPSTDGGFLSAQSRRYTYGQLIEIEDEISKADAPKGGTLRVADVLKNGAKSLVLSNKRFKIYIDHKAGAQIFGWDYKPRLLNLCAGLSLERFSLPSITMPGVSKTAFVDHIITPACSCEEFSTGAYVELGDLVSGMHEYKVRKSTTGVKVALSRNGSILQGDKNLPIGIEKVFGLDSDAAELSFVYQFTNASLLPYTFKLAIELTMLIPGALSGKATLAKGRTSMGPLSLEKVTLTDTVRWSIDDPVSGVKFVFVTQKPVTVWLWPLLDDSGEIRSYQGTAITITAPVQLDENTPWQLIGRVECHRKKQEPIPDAL